MGVFMEPVFDELLEAWEEGVWTYDRAIKTNFKMHVWYHYSLHDFLAYGIFCGWCVHGKFPCPVCKTVVRFIWLKNYRPCTGDDDRCRGPCLDRCSQWLMMMGVLWDMVSNIHGLISQAWKGSPIMMTFSFHTTLI
jgi:hypothetical protein